MSTTHQMMSSTTTNDLRSASIFELSNEELRERLRPAYEKIKQEAFAKHSYLTYYDPLVCPTVAHAVHEYRDRKELMWMDQTGKEQFVKIL
ncbi:hypothetical protein [uncultured Mucilaginibacter sp.]|uniref:hypothetical protein n=1 Tax=uncultured Mucilaginibacter sp. TaxID=797541 RepID=UPI002603111B|nr:hypothetical protein [uncultured Mucilaginibacter sp.]